jgi:hypothetical protein
MRLKIDHMPGPDLPWKVSDEDKDAERQWHMFFATEADAQEFIDHQVILAEACRTGFAVPEGSA